MNYILDTNIISELVASRPNPKVIHWIQSIDPKYIFLSVIVVGELNKGIEKLSDPPRKDTLQRWMYDDLLVRFHDNFLNIDVDTMLTWGKLVARLELLGRPISAIDSLLAATALQRNFTLVTRNTAHFYHTGISLFNPWDF